VFRLASHRRGEQAGHDRDDGRHANAEGDRGDLELVPGEARSEPGLTGELRREEQRDGREGPRDAVADGALEGQEVRDDPGRVGRGAGQDPDDAERSHRIEREGEDAEHTQLREPVGAASREHDQEVPHEQAGRERHAERDAERTVGLAPDLERGDDDPEERGQPPQPGELELELPGLLEVPPHRRSFRGGRYTGARGARFRRARALPTCSTPSPTA
jgi:hypothetical protein